MVFNNLPCARRHRKRFNRPELLVEVDLFLSKSLEPLPIFLIEIDVFDIRRSLFSESEYAGVRSFGEPPKIVPQIPRGQGVLEVGRLDPKHKMPAH